MKRSLSITIVTYLLCGCAADSPGNTSNNEAQAAALGSGQDACISACTDERGIEYDRCEALCSEPRDATCYTECIDAGGTQGACRMECYANADCTARCLADGGDEEFCRPECARDEQNSNTSAMDACVTQCIEDGGEPSTCRDTCADANAGSSVIDDDPCASASTDAYNNCIADGGDQESCRQAAADAHTTCNEER